MSELFFYLNVSALICGVGSLIFGLVQMLKTKQGTYYKVAMLALGTMTLGLLFRWVFVLCGGRASGFSVGFLSMIGSLLFLLTANRSYISVLEDAPTKHKKRASAIACILPALLFIGFGAIVWKNGLSLNLIPTLGLCIAAGLCTFFSFREILLPDVKRGFIDCMRPYNAAVCALSLCCMTMEVAHAFEVSAWVFLGLAIVGDASLILLSILLDRGMRQWRT